LNRIAEVAAEDLKIANRAWSSFKIGDVSHNLICRQLLQDLIESNRYYYDMNLCRMMILDEDPHVSEFENHEFPPIRYLFGKVFRTGVIVNKDKKRALEHFMFAATRGHIPSKLAIFSMSPIYKKIAYLPYFVYLTIKFILTMSKHPVAYIVLH